jgi:hypothetical protein
MIPKSGNRFSEKIMPDQVPRAIVLLAEQRAQLSKAGPALIRQVVANSRAAAFCPNQGGQKWAALLEMLGGSLSRAISSR